MATGNYFSVPVQWRPVMIFSRILSRLRHHIETYNTLIARWRSEWIRRKNRYRYEKYCWLLSLKKRAFKRANKRTLRKFRAMYCNHRGFRASIALKARTTVNCVQFSQNEAYWKLKTISRFWTTLRLIAQSSDWVTSLKLKKKSEIYFFFVVFHVQIPKLTMGHQSKI